MMPVRAAAFVAAVLLAGSPVRGQDERILSFHSDVTVHRDGWLTVTETIRIRAGGEKTERGIKRLLPARRACGWGTYVMVPLEDVRVRRDGQRQPYGVTRGTAFWRVRLRGRSGRLEPGEYTYTLEYRTRRHVRFFEDHDELVWNVTGHAWKFPIDRASATVALPEGAPSDRIGCDGHTGVEWAKGKNCRSWVAESGRAMVETTAPLDKGEALTVVVTFPKGIVAEPSTPEKLADCFRGNAPMLLALGGLLLVVSYYLLVWWRVGRDPPTGVIVPVFEPPEGLSPAAIRYVRQMGFDNRCLAAALVHMAVKGYLTIEQAGGRYAVEKSARADEGKLSAGERQVAASLFGKGDRITLEDSTLRGFRKALEALERALKKGCRGRYFISNLRWFVPGVLASVLTMAGAVAAGAWQVHWWVLVLGFVALAGSGGICEVLRQLGPRWKDLRRGGGGRWYRTGGVLGATAVAVLLIAPPLVMLVMLASVTSIWLLPILLALIVANVCFHRLVKRPTVEGRKVMDQIEGFRTYLATAEQEPLEYATAPGAPPQHSTELFERHLPYAAALDVENAWAHRLSQVMDRLDVDKDFRLPMWFRPGQRSSLGPAGFASAVGGSFLEALSAALKRRRSRGGETGPVEQAKPGSSAGKARKQTPE